MNRAEACNYLRSSGFSEEQIKAIEGAFTCEDAISALNRVMEYTYGMLTAEKAGLQHLIKSMLDDLPPVNPQKPKSECEHDYEILKAHLDGASSVLDKVRAEIDEQYDRVHPYDISCAEGLEMALDIVDKYKAEGSGEE